MIEASCPNCGAPYPVAAGHQCLNGADVAPSPWRDRKAQYHRDYNAGYSPRYRQKMRDRAQQFRMKAEELRAVADNMQSEKAKASMNRLADSYDALASDPLAKEA